MWTVIGIGAVALVATIVGIRYFKVDPIFAIFYAATAAIILSFAALY